MSRAMKIWGRIVGGRLGEEAAVEDERFGFVPGGGTAGAIFAVRRLIGGSRGKAEGHAYGVCRPGGGACDGVYRQGVWRCVRERGPLMDMW